mgnify:CR=1 FL=1|jgi:hypothetical protein
MVIVDGRAVRGGMTGSGQSIRSVHPAGRGFQTSMAREDPDIRCAMVMLSLNEI